MYRVGTLARKNVDATKDYYNKLLRRRNTFKVYRVGDFKFPELKKVNWDTGLSDSPLEQDFLSLFSDLGLKQVIDQPTHEKCSILDILLTNSPQSLLDCKVLDADTVCSSDHFPLSLSIKANVRRRRGVREVSKILNVQIGMAYIGN
jgi:hypothetical protein